jgi:hypothetical protein
VHGNWKVANGCQPSTCWVSWEKIKTCTIYPSSEAEGACFPRIGPTLSSTLGGPYSWKANPLGLYPTPTSVTLPLAFQASKEVTQYELNTVEQVPRFSFVGLGGGRGELEEFLKERYYLSLRSMFITKNVL